MSENMEEIENEIKSIREKLREADRAYYVDARPLMSDREYDNLFDTLKEFEEKYPQFEDPSSPTKRIGSDIDNQLPEREHWIPVLSLDKCYAREDLLKWIEKLETKFPGRIEVSVEPKIDGTGVVLYYNEGRLQYALTRGNGMAGNEITENIKTIGSVPLTVEEQGEFAVRGEVYMDNEDFDVFNKKYAEGQYANPRNLASGSLRRQKSSQTARFPLKLFVYEGFFKARSFSHHVDNFLYLKKMGFPLNDHFGFFSDKEEIPEVPFAKSVAGSREEIADYVSGFSAVRKELAYDIDGLVIKINDLALREELGFTKHHPRWAIAFKFDAPLAQTVINSIDIQVGRGGRITPVANLEPVKLSGSLISRATLHNQDYINALEVNIGDQVSISKRGDVIPAVEEVLEKGECASGYEIEKRCPACGSEIIFEGAHLFCFNEECPARKLGTLQHFAGKAQMDMDGLGDKTLEFLFEKGHVRNIYEIYTFDYETLIEYEGYKEKKIKKIKEAVESSKKKSFEKVLSSLGLKDIGGRAAELLARRFKNIDALIETAGNSELDVLCGIDGIGEGIARSVVSHFTNPAVLELIGKLKEAGLCFTLPDEPEEAAEADLKFSGTKWVVTGSFESFKPRDKAKEAIKKLGGQVVSSISKNTTYLLCGQDAGSKLQKARDLGVEVINENDFKDMIS